MLNIVEVQDQIFTSLETAIPQKLYEQGIPDADTIRKVGGKVVPYVALQFGTLADTRSGRSFSGARTFDYELPVQVQVVAADPSVARKIMFSNVYSAIVGLQVKWISEVVPDRIGGVFPITTSSGATEAYQYASGFKCTLQLSDV